MKNVRKEDSGTGRGEGGGVKNPAQPVAGGFELTKFP